MALQHRRTLPVQFPLQRLNDGRMVVSGIMYAITREEIQKPPPVFRLQFDANAAPVAHVHLQRIQQPYPLRVHVFLIFNARDSNVFAQWQHCTYYFRRGRGEPGFCETLLNQRPSTGNARNFQSPAENH